MLPRILSFKLNPATRRIARFAVGFFALSGMFFSVGTAFAADFNYKPLSPLPGTTQTVIENGKSVQEITSFSSYAVGFFKFSLGLATILAVIVIVIAGTERIAGAASESAQGKSREHMTNAVIGLIIAFGGWMVLNTIYPPLLNINIKTPSVTVAGLGSFGSAPDVSYGPSMCPTGTWCYIYRTSADSYRIKSFDIKSACDALLISDMNPNTGIPGASLIVGTYQHNFFGPDTGSCMQRSTATTGYTFTFPNPSTGETIKTPPFPDIASCEAARVSNKGASPSCSPAVISGAGVLLDCPADSASSPVSCCFDYIQTSPSFQGGGIDKTPLGLCTAPSTGKQPLTDCTALKSQIESNTKTDSTPFIYNTTTTSCYKYQN